MNAIEWQWLAFDELDGATMHALLAVRQQVFVLEQQCLYADIDGLDPLALHLLGWQTVDGIRTLVAYLRCFAPGDYHAETTLGRVLTVPAARGRGAGKQLMAEGIRQAERCFPGSRIRISAQQHLQRFYESFGFVCVSEGYLEDGIPHIAMLR